MQASPDQHIARGRAEPLEHALHGNRNDPGPWHEVNPRVYFPPPVKIALIRHMMDDPQGGARLIAWLARDLRELGEDVTLYCYGFDQERCFPDVLADVPVRCVRRVR